MSDRTSAKPSVYGDDVVFSNPVFDPNTKRNVVNHLQWLETDAEIIDEISLKKNNFSLLLLNIDYDNNTGNIIRSANAFGAKEIYLYGRKKYDRRASVGTEFYMKFKQVKFVEQIEPIFSKFDKVVALENNTKNTIPLNKFQWDKNLNYLICIGQEGVGLPNEILEKCDNTLEIIQLGSVRSLNVSAASGVIMYDYCLKTGAFDK